VTQENHLTIEQLSAYIDRQLSQQEQVECEAHLQRCRECRSILAELRQTASLLHELPQPELPRSFVLPAHQLSVVEGGDRTETSSRTVSEGQVSYTPQQHRSSSARTATRKGRSWQSYLRSSTRVISTIAAVLGIFIVTSTLLLSLPHGGASTASSGSAVNAPAFSSASDQAATQRTQVAQPPSAAGPAHNPHGTATSAQPGISSTPVNNASPAPVPEPQTAPPNGQQSSAPAPSVPLILDVSMPEGRIGIGFILLILGVLGMVFTRRRGK
jgi:anti-sigma factor RsiW